MLPEHTPTVRTFSASPNKYHRFCPDQPAHALRGRLRQPGGAAGAGIGPADELRSGIGPADELRSVRRAPLPRSPRRRPQPARPSHPRSALRGGRRTGAPAHRARKAAAGAGRAGHRQDPLDRRPCPVRPAPLLPQTTRTDDDWTCALPAACLTPRSWGTLQLPSPDPSAKPVTEHAHLANDSDLPALPHSIGLRRSMTASPATAPPARSAAARSAAAQGNAGRVQCRPASREAAMRAAAAHYWHPVGTCALGSDPAAGAVVDGTGRVHGSDNLWVIDASIMPVIPRATTDLPVVALAERLVRTLA
ncbi:GMC family oxidoreductase [Nonomuraea angiospora]|uniref:GMC family oxidoreductase n=1 Tax=Nonomuraea angiospora TaxID=46172 RepID=UPI0029BA8F32|nr:GMC family oxidoreductase [Nonomuraea angiospora]MDX3102083.1 GMC family oxidoreductase [Nonomuraea angiospora]